MSAPVHIGTITGATSPQVIDLTAGAAIGERVVVAAVTVNGGVPVISDSKSNTWTILLSRVSTSSPGNTTLFETVVTNAILDTDTITITSTGSPSAVTAVAVKVTDTLDGTTPRERWHLESQGNIAIWDAALGTTVDDFVALVFIINQAARTNTPTAPWTELTETAGTATRPIAACYIDASNAFQKLGEAGVLSGNGTSTVSMGVVYRKSGATVATPAAGDSNGGNFEAIVGQFCEESVGGEVIPTEGQLWPR